MSSFGASQYVLMIGIDGMGAFNGRTETPCMDELFSEGAVTAHSLSVRPTISGQCWTSMLTGATPETHGLSNSNLHPVPNLPTLVTLIRKAVPDAEIAAFTGWSAISESIIGSGAGADALDGGEDDALVERLLHYLQDHTPKFLFVQLDHVDGAGHDFGWGTEKYLESITRADRQVGRIADVYRQKGILDRTLVLVSADHGGTIRGSHGAWTEGEKNVFLGVAGPGVKKGTIGEVSIRDYPAIVLWALGIRPPEFDVHGYAAQLPANVFKDVIPAERKQVSGTQRYFESSPEPDKESTDWIGRFIPEDRISLFINFENGIEDVSGHCSPYMETGHMKHYGNGIRGMCGEFGNGIMHVDGVRFTEVFTLSFWHLVDLSSDEWLDVLTTKDGIHKGFSISAADGGMGIYFKEPNGSESYRVQSVGDEGMNASTWNHYMFIVDTVRNTVTTYTNFERRHVEHIPFPMADYFKATTIRCGVNKSEHALKMIDDYLILQGEVSPAVLERYYLGKK